MDAVLLPLPILSATGLLLLLIGYLLRRRLTARLQRITAATTGAVSGYSRPDDTRTHPRVDFTVDGHTYRSHLKYRYAKVVQGSLIEGSELRSDPLDPVLSIRRNSRKSAHPIPDVFPVGTPLQVHYNPDNPSENYAVRHPGSAMAPILAWVGLGLVLVAAVIGVLTWLLG